VEKSEEGTSLAKLTQPTLNSPKKLGKGRFEQRLLNCMGTVWMVIDAYFGLASCGRANMMSTSLRVKMCFFGKQLFCPRPHLTNKMLLI
jgi:hypothetical protein